MFFAEGDKLPAIGQHEYRVIDDQRGRFEEQAAARAAGDEDAMPVDEDYLLCMEYGMPPTSGWGMGVDRMVTLLSGQTNLRDSVLFPLLRPDA